MDHKALLPVGRPDDKAEMDRLFEQYKLAVEMWDRVRARRQISNSFYATINTALVAAIAAKESMNLRVPYICITGIVICFLWSINIYRYKALTENKKKVIIEIERILSCRPFSAEKQLSFTRVELGISAAFFLIYLLTLLERAFPMKPYFSS